IIIVTFLVGASCAADETKVNLDDCKWIWYPDATSGVDAPKGTRYFRYAFEPKERPGSARIYLGADNSCDLFVNGELTGHVQGWDKISAIEVGTKLRAG